ncbi:type I-E CRISPR-associated protein Cas5/CasD [Levilactobacillus brevis]|uniref:type I-E CRISPR-associated protein Cas5/CasD n=1 Tax=Levilactobacillus brevis TaxID=1580 RepID=UPI000E09270A|nr:type I-E CRISPR-associated protein Cas5/CasD [Levilactobacillus brevis]MBT9676476.1 type I-E CRISPR-associated protein Cas5/CasD [Levilactobacillus brevis]MBY7146732.1 type I-E CRISPR-associated protein Cas5/CasD [Levilactobacillus brevis]RDF86868.1 type I-E CRISPR-associated protein Cas5/CasD [Levilactobacillus brevis]
MKTLTIKLTAPLQSYGNAATFERRTTNTYPSKSAVIGMIAAALGYQRTDSRIVTLNELRFAVRIDQVGRHLTDFQTVEWEKDVRKVTYRDYLQDAVFVAAIGSENDQLIDNIEWALRHPRFQLFLGRRANVPAGVLQLQVFADATPITVLQKMTWQAAPWYRKRHQRPVLDILADADLLAGHQSILVSDRVVSFDQRDRQYGLRAMAKTKVKLTSLDSTGDESETQHDAMKFL